MKTNDSKIREYVEKVLGESISGYSEPTYLCPFCKTRGFADNPGHLHISYRKNKCICHRCDFASVNIFGLLSRLNRSLLKALLAKQAEDGLLNTVRDLLSPEKEDTALVEPTKLELPVEYKPIWKKRSLVGERCYEYLLSRGITDKQAKLLQIGYAAKGRFAGMLIFPVYVNGYLTFITSRRVLPGEGPKVLHSIGNRMSLLYNIDAAQDHHTIILSEGVFDALSWPISCGSGVAVMGKHLSREQALVISHLHLREAVVCFDSDAHTDTMKASKLLSSVCDFPISMILLDEGDPNSERKNLKSYFKQRKKSSLTTEVSRIFFT